MKQGDVLFTRFLFEAFYNWFCARHERIDIVVSAEVTETTPALVPFVKDGTVVLNITPGAVRNVVFGEHSLSFNARFNGTAVQLEVPYGCVLGVRNPELENRLHPINIFTLHTNEGVIMLAEHPLKTLTGEPVAPAPVPKPVNKGGLRLVSSVPDKE